MDVTDQPQDPSDPRSDVADDDSSPLDEAQLDWLRHQRRDSPTPTTIAKLQRSMKQDGLHPKGGLSGLRVALVAVGGFEDWVTDLDLTELRPDTSPSATAEQSQRPSQINDESASGEDLLKMNPEALHALIQKAREESDPQPLVRLWLFGKSPLDKRAREALDTLDDAAVTEEVRSTIDTLLQSTDLTAYPAGPVRRLLRFHKSEVPAPLRALALERLLASTGTSPVWFDDALNLAVGGPLADVAKEISAVSPSELTNLVTAAATLRLERNSVRERLYSTLLRSDHWQLLGQTDLWAHASLDAIAQLTKPAPGAPDLLSMIADTVVRPAVARSVRSLHLWRIFELVGVSPHLLPFIDPDDVTKASSRSDPSAQLFRAATASLSDAHNTAMEEAERRLEALRSDVADAEDRYQAEIERSSQQRREYEQVNERLRRSAVGSIEVHEAQVRQGRIDTLRTLAALAEELRNLAALKQPTSALIEQLSSDAVKHLRRFGVEVVGVAGEQRQHDPRLDGPSNEGAMVEVLSPAYVLAGMDDVTLRHAMTRPLPG